MAGNLPRTKIQKNAKFLRLTHLKVTKGSLFLSDLDTPENKQGNNKIPVYVPYGCVVDILLTDRTLTSYQQGSIRGFIDQGYLNGALVQNVDVGENIGVMTPIYEASIDGDLILANSLDNDVLVNLPNILQDLPEGTRITVKKVSEDDNDVIISAFAGNLIEGSPDPLVISDYLKVVTLQSDDEGNWWISSSSNSPAIETFHTDIQVPDQGILYLKSGDATTSALPWVFPSEGYLNRIALFSNVEDSDRDYNVQLFFDEVLGEVIPFEKGSSVFTSNLSQFVREGTQMRVRLQRQSGSGKSSFNLFSVVLQWSTL